MRRLSFLLFCFLLGFSFPVVAQVFWSEVYAPSGLFKTWIRDEYVLSSDSMIIGSNRAVYHEDATAIIDQRPYVNVFKSFSMNVVQTFGPQLSDYEKKRLAQHEVEILLRSYAGDDGILKKRNEYADYRATVQSATMLFEHPVFGAQAVKLKVSISDTSKFTQVAVVPANVLDDSKIIEFFAKTRIEDGLPFDTRDMAEEWDILISPLKIYSIQVPPKIDPYFEKDPVIKTDENAEMMRLVFRDPVRRQNVFYNTYGYRYKSEIDFELAQKLMGELHVKRHHREPSKIEFRKGVDEESGHSFIEAEYNIPSPEKLPYMNSVLLRGYFKENALFVQEVMGSYALVTSPFLHNVMRLYKFHPDRDPVVPIDNSEDVQDSTLE